MSTERIPFERLVEAIETVLVEAGASPEVAGILALNHAGCERDGALSHGVFRVSQYAETLRSGYLDSVAEPRVERVSSSYLRVDAAGGIAQLALSRARDEISRAVEEQGVAVVAIRDSQHHSALWPDLEPFADAGYVAVTAVTGGEPTVAPAGAHRAVLSTNPFAFAMPIEGAPHLIADFATSSMSYGDLTLAAQAGRSVPVGTGVDAAGGETTDPRAIVDGGVLLPFGGHKGAMLSMMVELLASALTGGDFSFEAQRDKPGGAHSTRTGQFLLVIDPDRGASTPFAGRASRLVQALRDAGMDRMPADHRYRTRAEAETLGIPVTPAIRELLDAAD
ncbi:Ldh family oxidoreductase [Leucobacter sp. wl10]|uniref:Ldh family oxidoreductase n=1 Tax=Leucobacter sp. wl10 TaxID=2304677 RepID=UPI000E5ADCD7|nr:Ldh family oxidoreductase [Leucobacter sp. wl10]RGE22037.1 Ldh family oxidoreductase [Leucobacter sp. wl10]